MEKTAIAAVSATPLFKREDCKRTKHDSAFSQWKILVGPCDWEDYLLNKEGAERYRTHNLPNCCSGSGLYELGIAVSLPQSGGKSSSKHVIPVYLGQADNVRIRLQQYGRDGAHLENSYCRKALGLFSDIFSNGFAIAYRWAPMQSKKDAEKTESQLLRTFDYAWNRGMNGERRHSHILKKLKNATSSTKTFSQVFMKLNVFLPKKVGLEIEHCDSPESENASSFYTKQEDILSRIFKFSRSRRILPSKELDSNNSNAKICGVALGHGSICTRPPVEGRKRCVDHKGMKVNAFVKPRSLSVPDDIRHRTCGVTLHDGCHCSSAPVAGRKRCKEHKGMRITKPLSLPFIADGKHHKPSSGVDSGLSLDTGTFFRTSCEESQGTCRAITPNGSFCKRKPSENGKFCWQHEPIRAKVNHSSCENPADYSYSSTFIATGKHHKPSSGVDSGFN